MYPETQFRPRKWRNKGESEGSSSGRLPGRGSHRIWLGYEGGEAGVKFGEGRGLGVREGSAAQGGGRTECWPELQQSGMSWNGSERWSESSPEGPRQSRSRWLTWGTVWGSAEAQTLMWALEWEGAGFKSHLHSFQHRPPQRCENQTG